MHQHSVHLDRGHAAGVFEQALGEGPFAGADFDDRAGVVVGGGSAARRFGDSIENGFAREKMLPKAAAQMFCPLCPGNRRKKRTGGRFCEDPFRSVLKNGD
jgi:hypothetical protein